MLKRMIFYVYNKCTKIYIVTDGFINTVTHSYEELTMEEMVVAINKAIGRLIEEIGIDISEYSKDYDEIYRFVEELMAEFEINPTAIPLALDDGFQCSLRIKKL